MSDPTFDPQQAINPPVEPTSASSTAGQDDSQAHDIFGGSVDNFDPSMFQPTDAAVTQKKETNTEETPDFNFNFDDLQASQAVHSEQGKTNSEQGDLTNEPEIIEPEPQIQATPAQERPEIIEQVAEPKIVQPVVKPRVVEPIPEPVVEVKIPEPEPVIEVEVPEPVVEVKIPEPKPVVEPRIVPPVVKPAVKEQVVEPQMTAGVKVQPRTQKTPIMEAKIPQPKPIVNPLVKDKAVPPIMQEQVVEPQMAPGVKVQPRTPREQIKEQKKPAPQVPTDKKDKDRETKPEGTPSSELKKKFDELLTLAKSIYTLEKRPTDEVLEIVGANNDKLSIVYQSTFDEHGISIKKSETEKASGEETVNALDFLFDEETNSVQVLLDEILLFDEEEHLKDDPKKKMQVVDKFNKFIFLFGEYFKKVEKEIKEKQEAELERKRLQDVFRNF